MKARQAPRGPCPGAISGWPSTSLTLRAGETSVSTTVFAIDDRFEDDDETILISAIHNGSVVGTQQTITIIDDDEPPLLAVSLSHTYLIEGVDDGLTLTLRYSNNTVFEPRGTDLLAERGLDISYESVRRWFLEFGAPIARNLRHTRPIPNGYWHLDEMVIVIRGQRYWLWRGGRQ